MGIKRIIRKAGKYLIAAMPRNEGVIRQSVLIVDNGYGSLEQMHAAIERMASRFPRAEMSVLACEHRKHDLQKDFPALDYVVLPETVRPQKYRVALQMLRMRKRKRDFIVLLSLDLTPLIAALACPETKIILYNQWGQVWSLRLRTVTEIFAVTYRQKSARLSVKGILKRIGLFFISLQPGDVPGLSVGIIDNKRVSVERLRHVIRFIGESLPRATIEIVSLGERNEITHTSPGITIMHPHNCLPGKYRIASFMMGLRKKNYDYVILFSSDITPILVSVLFMNSNVLLSNRWNQWWLLKPRSIGWYAGGIAGFIFNTAVDILVLVYLITTVSWLFLKGSVNRVTKQS
jgi:hypothetical protein